MKNIFKEKAPFGGANKKSEFPDAFVLEAVNNASRKRMHTLYVISSDSDMEKYADESENMLQLNTVDCLLDLVVRNSEQLKKPSVFADEIFGSMKADILERSSEILKSTEFYSGAIRDWNDEIYIISIDSIGIMHKNLIDVSGDAAEYEVEFKVVLTAQYSIADFDRSPWDPEDGKYMFVLQNDVIKKHEESFSAYVALSYADGLRANAEIYTVDFTQSALELTDTDSEIISYRELNIEGE